MEILTDILAIAGWACFGIFAASFSPKKTNVYTQVGIEFFGFVSFGLIAASLVLG
jgi:hypothetical protein